MSQDQPELLFLLFKNDSKIVTETTVRAALESVERSHHFYVLNVDLLPEVARLFEVEHIPCLVMEELQTGQRAVLTEDFSSEAITKFVTGRHFTCLAADTGDERKRA